MRKRTNRKHYALVDPIAHAIAGAAITTKDALDKLRVLELSALESLSKGKATVADWRALTDMLNLAQTMGLNGIGPEVLPICDVAQAELLAAAQRYEKTKSMVTTAKGLQALRDLYEYHDLQRSSVSRAEYERMIKKTRDYIISNNQYVVEVV